MQRKHDIPSLQDKRIKVAAIWQGDPAGVTVLNQLRHCTGGPRSQGGNPLGHTCSDIPLEFATLVFCSRMCPKYAVIVSRLRETPC